MQNIRHTAAIEQQLLAAFNSMVGFAAVGDKTLKDLIFVNFISGPANFFTGKMKPKVNAGLKATTREMESTSSSDPMKPRKKPFQLFCKTTRLVVYLLW